MQITSQGQITIPIEIREKLGFLPGTEVGFEIRGKILRLHKLGTDSNPGKSLISRMRGKATSGMTTDEIMAMTRGNTD